MPVMAVDLVGMVMDQLGLSFGNLNKQAFDSEQ
jgi:hypothetical protein